jgi:DNA polymerase-3 subunit alpha (Gram-positive type)
MIKTYIAFDLETTGLDVETEEIIEIGAVKVKDGKVVDRFMEFMKPEKPITATITNITGITNEMVEHARCAEAVMKDFVDFCEDYILVGHNIQFDYKFSMRFAVKYGLSFEKKGIDTLKIARAVHKEMESKSLAALCERYHIVNQAAHRAYHDALATAKVYQSMLHFYGEKEPKVFEPESLLYKPKKVQPMTKKQKEFLISLIAQYNLEPMEQLDSMTRSEASRKIDEILSIYGYKK